MSKTTQRDKILKWLLQGHTLTPIQALNRFGSFRLGARIYELRRIGYKINMKLESHGKAHYAKYWIYNGPRGIVR
jgi:hypothetical protein